MKTYNANGIQNKEDNRDNIINIQNKKREIDKLISNLYEDKISRIISQDTFSSLINKYEEQKQQLEIDIKKHEIYIPNITKYNDLIKYIKYLKHNYLIIKE